MINNFVLLLLQNTPCADRRKKPGDPVVFSDPVLCEIAKRHNKLPGQVLTSTSGARISRWSYFVLNFYIVIKICLCDHCLRQCAYRFVPRLHCDMKFSVVIRFYQRAAIQRGNARTSMWVLLYLQMDIRITKSYHGRPVRRQAMTQKYRLWQKAIFDMRTTATSSMI